MKNIAPIILFYFVLFPIVLAGCRASMANSSEASSNTDQIKDPSSISPQPSPEHIAGQIVLGSTKTETGDIAVSDENTPYEEESCRWFLEIDNEPSGLLDPVNLPKEFQKANTQVWVLFSGMRRMNRCPEANPVWIQDIALRKS